MKCVRTGVPEEVVTVVKKLVVKSWRDFSGGERYLRLVKVKYSLASTLGEFRTGKYVAVYIIVFAKCKIRYNLVISKAVELRLASHL